MTYTLTTRNIMAIVKKWYNTDIDKAQAEKIYTQVISICEDEDMITEDELCDAIYNALEIC